MGEVQRRLQMALNAAKMAIWDSRIVNGQVIEGTVYWSASGAALLGLPPRPLNESFRDFLGHVHGDDRERVLSTLQAGVDRRGAYELQYRVLWPDGSEHWLEARAEVFCDRQRRPMRTLGVIWDITAQRQQEALNAERQELSEVTLHSIGDGVMATDPQGKTRYLNRVAEQLTGWSNALAQGLDIRDTLQLADENTGAPRTASPPANC